MKNATLKSILNETHMTKKRPPKRMKIGSGANDTISKEDL
jgi:hypothetical protein